MGHFQHGVVGRLRSDRLLHCRRCRLTSLYLPPAPLSQRQMVERWFAQSDMAALFLYGGVTLPWAPVSDGSRKMDEAGGSGMGSTFTSRSR